jgi:hypothetical protein
VNAKAHCVTGIISLSTSSFNFLRRSGSRTRSTQPREDNCGASSTKKRRLRSRNPRVTALQICCADHATPVYLQTLTLTSPTSGGRLTNKQTQWLFVHKLTISTEWPPLVGELSVNIFVRMMSQGQHNGLLSSEVQRKRTMVTGKR